MSTQPDWHPRTLSDRRSRPTSPLSAFRPGGRRLANRRAEDDLTHLHFDRFPARTLALVVLLLLLTIADGVLTLILLDAGCEEANALMQVLLDRGPTSFLLGKFLLTAVGLPFLVVYARHRMFLKGLTIGHVVPIAVALYGVLIVYQIILLLTI